MNLMLSVLSRRFVRVALGSALAVAAVALGGCNRGDKGAGAGAEEGKTGTTTTNAADQPAKAAAKIVGKWASADGNDILNITGATMSREYKKVPDAPKVVMPYVVSKDEGGVVTLIPTLETKDGKKMKLDPQVFTVVDADTISGGLAGKTPATFKRAK